MSENPDKIKIIKNLQLLGLREKEALVYMALLELGQAGSSKIIQKTGLHGQFVYDALATLDERGLSTHVVRNGRKKFSANPLKRLESLVSKQQEVLESVTRELRSLSVLPEAQQFEVYQGDESYRDYEFQYLEKVPESSVLNIIGGGKSNNKFFDIIGDQWGDYQALRRAKKIKVRYIGSADQEKFQVTDSKDTEYFEQRVLPGKFSGLVNTNIWPNAVGFNLFGNPVMAFVITNKEIADSYNQFFEVLWNLSK